MGLVTPLDRIGQSPIPASDLLAGFQELFPVREMIRDAALMEYTESQGGIPVTVGEDDPAQAARELTGGMGMDVVFEAGFIPRSLLHSRSMERE